MALGTKRAAPDDFDSSSAVARPAPPHRQAEAGTSSTSTATDADEDGAVALRDGVRSAEQVTASAQGWVDELSERVEAIQETQGEGGRIVLGLDEARGLMQTLQEVVSGYLETPATRGDILALMQHITQATTTIPSPLSLLASSARPRPSSPHLSSTAAVLPSDIISLILLELKHSYLAEQDTERGLFGHRGGEWGWWANLRLLRTVSQGFKEVCDSLYRSQLHINDVKHLPSYARRLGQKPRRGKNLKVLHIAAYDFEYSFSRSSEDAGFAIPELVERAPNLHTFSLTADRPASYTSSAGVFRRRQRFETLTGGISLPTTIATTLTNLRILVYGAPCSLADIALFASEIPTLSYLDVLGEVEHSVVPAAGFKPCSRSLKRLWLPSTALTATQLETLLLGVPAEPLDDSTIPRITSLAFTFDPEEYFQPTPPSEDDIVAEIARLVVLFEGIGSQLTELFLSMPAADMPDATRIAGVNGGWAPGGGGGVLTFIVPLGAQQGGAGGAAAGGLFGGLGAAAAGGGGAGQGAAGGQNAPPGGAAAGGGGGLFGGPAPPAAAGGGGGGAGGGNGPAARVMRARRAAPAANPPPGGAAPPGAANAPAPPPLFPQFGVPGAAAVQPTPHPFFERLIAAAPNVEHLELFGRRYGEDFVAELKHLPLRHLALSVPVDSIREKVAGDLLEALEKGEWSGLRRLELSGRGGEWAPAERRKVKQAVEARGKVVYKSTDMKG
ncbi:hypothetical protein JCM6882_003499 [Rhodosporidiobolus microsporus]